MKNSRKATNSFPDVFIFLDQQNPFLPTHPPPSTEEKLMVPFGANELEPGVPGALAATKGWAMTSSCVWSPWRTPPCTGLSYGEGHRPPGGGGSSPYAGWEPASSLCRLPRNPPTPPISSHGILKRAHRGMSEHLLMHFWPPEAGPPSPFIAKGLLRKALPL